MALNVKNVQIHTVIQRELTNATTVVHYPLQRRCWENHSF